MIEKGSFSYSNHQWRMHSLPEMLIHNFLSELFFSRNIFRTWWILLSFLIINICIVVSAHAWTQSINKCSSSTSIQVQMEINWTACLLIRHWNSLRRETRLIEVDLRLDLIHINEYLHLVRSTTIDTFFWASTQF